MEREKVFHFKVILLINFCKNFENTSSPYVSCNVTLKSMQNLLSGTEGAEGSVLFSTFGINPIVNYKN